MILWLRRFFGEILSFSDRRSSQEPNRSETYTITIHNIRDSISKRKPKIKIPKSTEEAKYKNFDD